MLAEKDRYTVGMMAEALEVSRSGFYSWLANGCPEDDDSGLAAAVEAVWLESDRRTGARSILPLMEDGTTLYGVRKCMRRLGIRGVHPNAKKRTTDS